MKRFCKLALLLVLSCSFSSGCALSAANYYGNVYNNAIKSSDTIALLSSLPYKEIHENAANELEQLGYERVIFSDQKQGFYVIIKNQNLIKAFVLGSPTSHKIILKYTDWGNDQTRIDLVNNSESLLAKPEVTRDIENFKETFITKKIAVAIDSKISKKPN